MRENVCRSHEVCWNYVFLCDQEKHLKILRASRDRYASFGIAAVRNSMIPIFKQLQVWGKQMSETSEMSFLIVEFVPENVSWIFSESPHITAHKNI